MPRTIGAFEARRQFGQLLKQVSGKGESYVVEYHGEPVAALVPIDQFTKWQERRAAFFEHMRATSARANMTPEDAERLIAEEIEADRRGQ
jgi:prevent-host-death family protein